MTSYAFLFERDNEELYKLFKPFVPILPDFRPLDTISKMKEGTEDSKQNNWQVLFYEVGILTSTGREKDRELVERLLMGPLDDKDETVTRNANDFSDFFSVYPGLSWIIPYSSTCLQNVDRFYLSRGKFNLLHVFRPSLYHIHDVRDEKTFHWLLKNMNLEEWECIHTFMKQEEILELAVKKKSYGLLLMLQERSGCILSKIPFIRSLSFSPDLFSSLASHINWDGFLLSDLDNDTNVNTLTLAIEKGYISPYWFLDDILLFPPTVFLILFTYNKSKQLRNVYDFKKIMEFIVDHGKNEEYLTITEEFLQCLDYLPRDVNALHVWDFVYNSGMLRNDVDHLMTLILKSGKLRLNLHNFPVNHCLALFSRKKFYFGMDWLVIKLKEEKDLSFLELDSIPPYLFDKNEVLPLLMNGIKTNMKEVLITALRLKKKDIVDYLVKEKNIIVDADIILSLRLSMNVSQELLLFIASYIPKENIFDYIDYILHILLEPIDHPLLFILYEIMGYGDLYSKIKEEISERKLQKIAIAPLRYRGELPLTIKLFFESCRFNVTGMINILEVDPTIHKTAGLLIAIENKSTNVALEILSDKRVNPSTRNNEPLIMAIKRGNVDVVETIIQHPSFNISGLVNQLPIELYEGKKFSYHQRIIEILKTIPELRDFNGKIVEFLY